MPIQVSRKKFQPSRRSSPPLATIEAARAGDERAMEELIREYQGRVAGFVIAQSGEDHYEDLCQTVFVKMVIGLPRLKSAAMFESWLFKIARNVCMDHHRGRLRWLRIFDPFEPWHESIPQRDTACNRDRMEAIDRALNRLSPPQRQLLGMSLEKERSYKELARLSGVSTAALKLRLFRARARLRQILLRGEITG